MCLTHPTTRTSLPNTGIRRPPAPLRTEDYSLAAWSNPLLPQVLSLRLASTSAVSTRRSTTPGSALYETNRELESQSLELYQANQWADQAQREKNLFA